MLPVMTCNFHIEKAKKQKKKWRSCILLLLKWRNVYFGCLGNDGVISRVPVSIPLKVRKS